MVLVILEVIVSATLETMADELATLATRDHRNIASPCQGVQEDRAMTGMCPYCGIEVRLMANLTATHEYPESSNTACPGSMQNYRNAASDARLLWNGERNERFCG